ncbi:MFS multidrug transporter-like protein [Stachybotrys elegans]|uniref:MFS multidrug transporter-like protein n=1 Tax=Stachybotrys elegans TaxID=80388 RepID=A0A8K0SZV3_9HYPO|nr:MFS multidrug transporter-like protein [Stachybotrys elegans]
MPEHAGPGADPDSGSANRGHLRSWRLFVVIATLCLGVFLYGLDSNIIGTALPQITTDFQSLSAVAWYGAAYLLTVTAFQPLFGILYKFFSTKLVYLASMLLFEVASIVCATASTSNILIFGRALLGLGAAGLLQGALAIIRCVVSLDKVPLFQGIVISSVGISVCVGPIIGGALTQYATWRWCFWINVPAGFCAIIIIFLFVPLSQGSEEEAGQLTVRQKLGRIDAIGTILFLGLVCCLLLALTWGGQQYLWSDARIIGLLVAFGVLLILFCYWDWRQGELALIPLRVLRKRSISMGSLVLFSYGLIMYVYGYYLPIFFQSAQGVSATESGVRYIAMMAPQILTLVATGALVSKWGYYVPFMIAGTVICSVGSGLLTTIDITTSTVTWAAYLVLTGIGVGMASQLPYTALQVVLDPVDVPVGNAIAVFSSQLGGAIGLAIGQNLLVTELFDAVPQHTTIDPNDVVAVGASGLTQLTNSSATLQDLRRAYGQAVRDVFILGLAFACFAAVPCLAMEWLNIKHEAIKRKQSLEVEGGEKSTTGKQVTDELALDVQG